MSLEENAKEARKEYLRKWYKKNPEKRKLYQERYWTKRAAERVKQEKADKEIK